MEELSQGKNWEANAKVMISTDKMMATLLLAKPEAGTEYNLNDITRFLKKKGIIQGIDIPKIQRMLNNQEYGDDVCVARGKSVVHGKDGRFEFDFRTDLLRYPEADEDGEVDYRKVQLMEVVKEGQKIARYIPPTKGEFGFTITGELIIPQAGKDLRPLRGKGLVLSGDRQTYYAGQDGTITYKDDRIEIERALIISGNVDSSTGNLDYDGNIYITGDVLSGMRVNAGGDIQICGSVESAIINCGGDIVVHKGMRGSGVGYISAQGNVFGKFFDNVRIKANEYVEANQFTKCKIDTPKKVYATGNDGTILGGKVHATKGVQTVNCGNSAEVETVLNCGISQESMFQYNVLRKNITKIDSEIKVFEDGKRAIEDKVNTLELIQHSVYVKILEAIQVKKKEKQESLARLQELLQQLSSKDEVKIQIKGEVHAGVKIIIDTYELKITKTNTNVTFIRDDNHIIMNKAK